MEAIVIGAGPAGLATARGLVGLGAEVAVYEAGPRERPQGSGLSLFGNGIAALGSLGLGAPLARLVGDPPPILGGVRSPRGDWLTGPSTALGSMRVVHREELAELLLGELPRGTVRFDTPVEVVSADAGTVALADGTRQHADLVVAADGIRSASRRHVTTDPGTRHVGHGAWRGVTRTPVPGVVPAETWGAGLRFGALPLTDGRIYWFAVSNAAPAGSEDPRKDVLDLFDGWHDPIRALVAATDPDVVSWLPIEELARPLPAFARGRAVLVGDAAHAMTPNLGQGANQGFEDAATLCALLRAHPDAARLDISAVLARYDRLRRPRTRRIATQARLLGVVGQLSRPRLVRARDLLLRATPRAVAGWQFSRFASWRPPSDASPARRA